MPYAKGTVEICKFIRVPINEADDQNKTTSKQNDLPFGLFSKSSLNTVLEIIPKYLHQSPGACHILKTNI